MAIKRRQEPEPLAPKKTKKRKHKYFENEKALALPVIQHFNDNGFEVWQEAQLSSHAIHDIVAVKDGLISIIECKLSLTLSVMSQAHFSNGSCNIKYIAVPAPDKTRRRRKMSYLDRGFPLEVCNRFGIGVLYVHPRPDWADNKTHHHISVEVVPNMVASDANGPLYTRIMKKLLTIPKEFCEAGGKGGGYFTPYKATIKNVRDIIEKFPGIHLSTIISELKGKHHYAHDRSARSSLRSCLKSFEKKWCFVDESAHPEKYYCNGEEPDADNRFGKGTK